MNHLDEGLLHAWMDDEVGPVQGAHIEQHLQECAVCAELLEAAARDRAAASELLAELGSGPRLLGGVEPGGPVPVAEAPSRPVEPGPEVGGSGAGGWRRLAWAASIVLAVALGWFARPVDAPSPVAASSPQPPLAAGEPVRQEREARRAAPVEALADAMPEASDESAPEPGATVPRERVAAMAASPAAEQADRGTAVGLATPAEAATWIGRAPLVPEGMELRRIELRPARSVPGSRGSAPVVVLEFRTSRGETVRVFQQRVESIAAASESTGDVEETATPSARGQIGDLLVLVEGADAAGILAQLRDRSPR